MKKILFLVLMLLAFFNTSFAEEIPTKFDSIMNVWDASTTEELRINICRYWMSKSDHPNMYDPKHFPVKIQIGGNTENLIKNKKNWDMAIVSSKDVDLTKLSDERMLTFTPYTPTSKRSLHEWLLVDSLKKYIPYDSPCEADVYVYDYLPETDEAILMIMQNDRWRKSGYINFGYTFLLAMIERRPAELVRRLETINCVWDWSAEELLNKSSEWDVALLENFPLEDIKMLDQAGILRYFDDIDYFVQRPAVIQIPDNHDSFVSRIYNEAGCIVAIPYETNGGNSHIMLVNAHGYDIPYALQFVEHCAKSYEWFFQADIYKRYKAPNGELHAGGKMIPREEVDW